jgi:hypothetical protein
MKLSLRNFAGRVRRAYNAFRQNANSSSSLPLWPPPGHFYSPIVDPTEPNVQSVIRNFHSSELASDESFTLDKALIEKHLSRIAEHHARLDFPEHKTPGRRYYYRNPAFSFGDAIALFGMMLEYRPKRIVEVGSGFSSCVMMDTNDHHLNHEVDLTFIEPYPETLLALLKPDDGYRNSLIQKPLQSVPLDVFQELEANDILFIDSSHVAKTGSDVLDVFFRILPALRPGVLVHIHDIPYPFEYNPDWIAVEKRSWNEAYFLRAFLQYNQAFEIIYFSHFVYRHFERTLAERMPFCLQNCGASIWLRKRYVQLGAPTLLTS